MPISAEMVQLGHAAAPAVPREETNPSLVRYSRKGLIPIVRSSRDLIRRKVEPSVARPALVGATPN